VEGKTEGAKTLWGKGLFNIIKPEASWMRHNKIFHRIDVCNGKQDLLDGLEFRVANHICPPAKTRERCERVGKPIGDCVMILLDLDCQDEAQLKATIDKHLTKFAGHYSAHVVAQEIESWMVSDPDAFRFIYRQNTDCVVRQVLLLSADPERADCNPKISNRLEEAIRYCSDVYRKTIEGPQLLGAVNPDVVATKCPHFHSFRSNLRNLIDFP